MAAKKKTVKKSALAAIEPELRALDDVKPPAIPVEHLVAEGHALAKLSGKYEKELRAVGVDKKLIAAVGTRATALAEAQGSVTLIRRASRSAKEVDLEKKGIELRSELVADGRFALRDDPDAQATLDHIQEGSGLDDLVQDLRDLSAFFARHKAPLAKVGAKPAVKKALASKLADDLADNLAVRRTGDAEERSAMGLRDRAATHLLDAMREIRAAGTYAFRKKPEIVARFRGTYGVQKRARAKANRAKANGVVAAPVVDA